MFLMEKLVLLALMLSVTVILLGYFSVNFTKDTFIERNQFIERIYNLRAESTDTCYHRTQAGSVSMKNFYIHCRGFSQIESRRRICRYGRRQKNIGKSHPRSTARKSEHYCNREKRIFERKLDDFPQTI